MHASWSRWLFGAWAVVATLWVLVAMLMLVQTWPDPSFRIERGDVIGNLEDESLSGQAMRGNAGGPPSGAADHVKKFLLLALLPPGFLLLLVLIALWIGGLPLPYSRRDRREQLTNSRHAR
ncbi:MAG TPA: hypothetical protein VFR73_11440 [Hyphomicrobiaceae bacterium]|nr:hypothetical protein [Hyphomicrobiaceae bacterium]